VASDEVFNDIDSHRPLYAMPTDVARAGLKAPQAYTDLIRSMTYVIRSVLPKESGAERHAEAIVSLCVGGMVLGLFVQCQLQIAFQKRRLVR
jgi:TetR/AcrR family transcriptional regulator, transcriptional repressor for nem operon